MDTLDDLTQYKACPADEVEVGDILVNLGKVKDVYHAGDRLLIEWWVPGIQHYSGKTYRSDQVLVREAREHEIEHDFDHNIDHGGEG